jgi:glutamate-1-semialdehyde 2,1-aminomutase
VYLAPSKYEAWFLTIAHTEADIDMTLEAAEASFRELA